MQYEITLPADYDMRTIRQRVVDKGHLLDDFAGLGLKAFLVRERGVAGSPVNQYAPFYLWNTPEGMNTFLWGPGFQALSADFGRPAVRQWSGLALHDGPERAGTPQSATRLLEPIAADADPAEVIGRALAAQAPGAGVHCVALAVDTARWELLTFTLWAGRPPADALGEHYEVLHLCEPEPAKLPQGRQW